VAVVELPVLASSSPVVTGAVLPSGEHDGAGAFVTQPCD
jgi:hypothetical protein